MVSVFNGVDSGIYIPQLYMESSDIKALPVDLLNGWADHFKTFTRVDTGNSVNIDTSVVGKVSPSMTRGSDQVATMTSDVLPSPWVTSASSVNGANAAYRAFDNNNSNYWHSAIGSPQWIKVDSGSNITVQGLTLKQSSAHGFVNAMPKDFILESSPDNATWTTRITRTNEPVWTSGEKRTYDMATAVTARYWRLTVTADEGYTYTVIDEIELLGAYTYNNMDLRLVAQDIDRIPSTIDVYALVEEISAITLNTDLLLYATRNNGTTWTVGTITSLGIVAGYRLIKATISVGAQSSGDDIAARFVTANNKQLSILAVYMEGK